MYLGFAAKTTNLLSNSGTSGIGEAPQLSPTYAEYDDGASVFSFYDNFAGTSLNTSKWTYGSLTPDVNDGLTFTCSDCNGYLVSIPTFGYNTTIDWYGYIPTPTTSSYASELAGYFPDAGSNYNTGLGIESTATLPSDFWLEPSSVLTNYAFGSTPKPCLL